VGGGIFRKDGTSQTFGVDWKEAFSDAMDVDERPPAGPVDELKANGTAVPKMTVPKSASEFMKVFRTLGDEDRWSYLQLVPPDQLSPLFGSALEPDILAHIISALSQSPPQPLVASYLSALPQISRFPTIRLFLPPAETSAVRDLLTRTDADASLRRAWSV